WSAVVLVRRVVPDAVVRENVLAVCAREVSAAGAPVRTVVHAQWLRSRGIPQENLSAHRSFEEGLGLHGSSFRRNQAKTSALCANEPLPSRIRRFLHSLGDRLRPWPA